MNKEKFDTFLEEIETQFLKDPQNNFEEVLKTISDLHIIEFMDEKMFQNFIETMYCLIDYILYEDIYIEKIESRLIDIGKKYGLLDCNLENDYDPSSLREYAISTIVNDHLKGKYGFVTEDDGLLGFAEELAKEYGVKPIKP